uniref:Uncharacterized protein n=1 Tax=Anguilla anguilla TaxID=7936 RepID=A0A0E9S3K4_ANGAN
MEWLCCRICYSCSNNRPNNSVSQNHCHLAF